MTTDPSAAFMQIFPASAETIRSWSHGQVRNPELLNYRSLKPEKGGLFCQRIFGPVKDFECECGKYKGAENKGIVCDRCGVEVARSLVRRERMGHIELAVPVVHPWFLHRNKIVSDLLCIEYQKLVKVVYFEAYLIIEMKGGYYDSDFYPGQVISYNEYLAAERRYGSRLVAKMGAEAVLAFLKNLDLREISKSRQALIRRIEDNEFHFLPDKANAIDMFTRQINAIQYFLDNDINPADMVLTVLPVFPPDLRPLVPLDGRRFATADINVLYSRVINRSSRIKNLLQLPSLHPVILPNEKRMLQEAVDALIENGLPGNAVTGAMNRTLVSLTHQLGTGREWRRQGHFAKVKAGKMVDFSASTAAVPDCDLPDDTVLIPYKIAKILLEPFIISELKRRDFALTVRRAKKMIENDESPAAAILEYSVPDFSVLVTHPPVVNNLRARFFRIRLTTDCALHLSPNAFYDMEFDKPSPFAKIFLPLSRKAQYEAKYLAGHPLRQKKRNPEARIMLKMLEYDTGHEPLLCPSCEYAVSLNELNHFPVNTHIRLPGKIHTSIGGALLALEIPDILSPEKHPATVEAAEKLLADTKCTPRLNQLFIKYSYLIESEEDDQRAVIFKDDQEGEIFKDDYLKTYDWGLIGFQKKKFAESLPVRQLNLESVYISAFADLAYRTWCRNKLYHECSVEDCPAHGLSGKEICLCSARNGRLPCFGSAVGLEAVYKLIGFFAETKSKNAVQMIYQYLLETGDVVLGSTDELENKFHFPKDFPLREFELLLAVKKQQNDPCKADFFYAAAKNPPDAILNAVFESRKISLTSPDAIPFSGEKPETCAAETAIKQESWTNALSPSEWMDLMAAFPEMGQYCPWSTFKRQDFVALFGKFPMRLDYVSIAYQSRKLHIADWIDIFEDDLVFFFSEAKQIFTPEEFELIAKGIKTDDFQHDNILKLPSSSDDTDNEQADSQTSEEIDPDDDWEDISGDLDDILDDLD